MADIIGILGNWTTDASWAGGLKPTAADRALLDATTGNMTADNGGAVARALDCTGFTATLTHNSSSNLTLGDGTAPTGNIALKFVPAMTYTPASLNTSVIRLFSSSATQLTIETAAKALGQLIISNFSTSGSYLLSDDLTVNVITQQGATFNTNAKTLNIGSIAESGGNSRVLTITNSTINVLGTSGTVFNLGTSPLTFTATGSTINITVASSSARALAGNGKTFGNFNYIVNNSSGQLTVTGANTFNNFACTDTTAARTLILPNGATNTIGGTLTLNGAIGAILTINSASAGNQATISKASGTVILDYCRIKDMNFTGGATFIARNSINDGNNTGITFEGGMNTFGDEGLVS